MKFTISCTSGDIPNIQGFNTTNVRHAQRWDGWLCDVELETLGDLVRLRESTRYEIILVGPSTLEIYDDNRE